MRATLPTALIAAGLLVQVLVTTAPARAATCPDNMTFAVGGTANGDSIDVPGVRGRHITPIQYPGSLAPLGNIGGDDSVAEGERALDTAARAYRSQCPDTHIEVVGHSQGALVAGNVRDQWNNDPSMRDNTNVVVISDPRARNGVMSQLPSIIPGFTHTGPRPDSTIPTSSVCHHNDGICNIGNPFNNPGHAIGSAIGYLTGAHDYNIDEVQYAPGQHDLPAVDPIVPSTPLHDDAPNLRDTLEPVTQAIVPDAPIIIGRYEPTPIRDYIPRIVQHLVPDHVLDVVLPPLPQLPKVQW